MAELVYNITGSVTGLNSAANAATGILNNLQAQADKLKIRLFGAESTSEINSIGGALTIITSKIKEYTDAAIKGSQAFKDQQASAAVDALSIKLSVLNGNVQLFGQSVNNSQAQVRAYQSAIDALLKQGFDPLDNRIQSFKSNIDRLTQSIETQKAASRTITDPFQKFRETGALLVDAENKVNNLQNALRNATSERSVSQYNVRLREAQIEYTRLNSLAQQNNGLIAQAEKKVFDLAAALRNATSKSGITQVATDLKKAQGELSALNALANKARGGFNSVGIEFGRVIQDLPYAANNFGAVGNNITRIVEVIPGYLAQTRAMIVANGGVATSATVAKTALAGLFTGVGGILLAISAAVSAFTIYQQVQQSSARKAEELANATQKQKQELEKYIEALDATSKVSAQAANEYANEATKLDILYRSLQSNSNARYGNISALEELQKSWPQEFSNLQQGAGFADQLTASYNRLRESLLQVGLATAAQSLAAESQKKLVQNTVALADANRRVAETQKEYNRLLNSAPDQAAQAVIASDISSGPDSITIAKKAFEAAKDEAATFRVESFKARQEYNKYIQASQDAQSKIKTPVKSGLVYDLERQISLLKEQQPLIKDRALLDANVLAIKQKQAQLDELLGKEKNTASANTQLTKTISLQEQLNSLLDKVKQSAGQSGLEGYQLELRKILDFYGGVNKEIDKFIRNVEAQEALFNKTNGKQGISKTSGDQLIQQAVGLKGAIVDPFNKEISDAQIKEAERVANEIQRINDAFGVKATESREKELAQIKAAYDREIRLAKGKQEIIDAIESGKTAAEAATNRKFDNKAAQPFVDFFDKVRKKQSKAADKEESELARVISRSLRSFGQSFIETLSSAETYAKGTFTSIFSDLTTKLTSSLNGIFQNIVLDGLSKSLSQAISNGTSGLFKDGKITGLGGAIAGGGLLGGILSAATPQTSTIGQAGGGLLSGAASGAAIGSIIPGIGTVAGAIAGGLIGAIGGIFGSSSARKKQEELQKQQLEESKKQTELLRQAQAAYTSQIIGRFTQFGTISGINVGAYGQLIATVSGRDLQFILDRNNNGR